MQNLLFNKHIISIANLQKSEIDFILNLAEALKRQPTQRLIEHKIIASCFFEPSTRTRLSFEAATLRLGANIIGFDSVKNTSSGQKGECLSDAIKIIGSYCDLLIIRHPQEGAAKLASQFANVPVINAGDGANQHPTQTLLDLFSIKETQATLENLTITLVGDLKYGRTVHSLVQALSLYNCKFNFFSPKALPMPDYICQDLRRKNVQFQSIDNFEQAACDSDIIYMTRLQKERLDPGEYETLSAEFTLTPEHLKNAKPNLKILHPLPRVTEICHTLDKTPFAYYFEQATNGLYIRQALLAALLNENLTL